MKRILVIRNDKIGDFMLAWPALALLKGAGCHLTVLVPAYTAPLARLCPFVDEVICDPGESGSQIEQAELLQTVADGKFDAALTLFSTWRVGVLLRKAGVSLRVAPATKFAQILYNHRVTQRRSRSEKPEWEYNLDLAAALLKDLGLSVGSVAAPYLQIDTAEVVARRHAMAARLSLPTDKRWLMVHAGSGGSANNLSMRQYEELVCALAKRLPNWVFVLTAGPAERLGVGHLMANLINRQVPVAMGTGDDLTQFTYDIAVADAFMAGSTGPLHIAGALDVPTVGFYPLRRSATALRWQTLNSPKRRLAISPTASMPDPESFKGLDVDAVADQIAGWLEGSASDIDSHIDEPIGI
ncbi:glycosyltransferase family 9 protein [Orrella daihaiensis]|uniref:Glycosyltransferase family 9 protein n=1 Tax=Orrella daihaiensis TaxID=2782176 RepID=A0ABY4AML2_9BURK|nr:glycosyltransferase family 9 protein [Orrella daihaiensis]UOD50861.1 glycosyltransferase family 9 protein [Orrella daihaiensis]